jgi:hypothetical protein
MANAILFINNPESDAFKNGWFAHKNNISEETNPHDEKLEEYSYYQFTSGWCARHQWLKHGQSKKPDIDES